MHTLPVLIQNYPPPPSAPMLGRAAAVDGERLAPMLMSVPEVLGTAVALQEEAPSLEGISESTMEYRLYRYSQQILEEG